MQAVARVFEELDPAGPPVFRWIREPEGSDRVALLLGAFDPPTRAHVAVARGARRATGRSAAFCLTKVLLAREDVLLPPVERLGLLADLAAETGAGLATANRGTYLEVARAARAAGVDAVFVIGSDKLPQLADPAFYPDGEAGVEATFAEVRFLVIPRGVPVDRPGVEVLDASEVFEDPSLPTISATEVRDRLRRGEDVEDLVPPPVARALRRYTDGTEPG